MRKRNVEEMPDADIAALECAESVSPQLTGYIDRTVVFPPYSPGVDGDTGSDPIILKIAVPNTMSARRMLADMHGSRVVIHLRGFDQSEMLLDDSDGAP